MSEIISIFQSGNYALLVIYILGMFLAISIAVSFHEWAHAFVAYKLGDPTAKNMGRLTLDPFKHIDLLGIIFFLIFKIGWAKPVMINSRNLKHFRRDTILISIAGVVTNLLLSFVFYGVYFFLSLSDANAYILFVVMLIMTINISFAIFNILPIPPLDGFHVFTSLFIRKNYKAVQILNRYGFLILIALLFTGWLGKLLTIVSSALYDLYNQFFMLFV
jgi:Zn-dependent protease